MNTNSQSLVVPLIFRGISELRDGRPNLKNQKALNPDSFLMAKPSRVVSWGLSGGIDVQSNATPSKGAVIGCRDGSMYIFHPTPSIFTDARVLPPLGIPSILRSKSPSSSMRTLLLHGRHLSSTGSASSSGFHSPCHLASTSQIVFGVNTEQVEAPKNHLGFEDGAGRLKAILEGKWPRDKTIADNLLPTMNKGASIETISSSPLRLTLGLLPRRKEELRSLVSAKNSPTITLRSISKPISPSPTGMLSPQTPTDGYNLYLRCHITPPRSGARRSVTGMQLLSDNCNLAVLQEIGDLSILQINDGGCIATINVDENYPYPPGGDGHGARDVWTWERLIIIDIGETTLIWACATVDSTSASFSSLEAAGDDRQEKTRLVVVEFSKCNEDQGKLERVGECYTDGPVEGIKFHHEFDNTLSCIYVSSSGCILQQKLRVVPSNLRNAPVPEPLHLFPLSFKSSKATVATEHHPAPRPCETGRIALDQLFYIGKILSSPTGLRTFAKEGKLSGLVWSQQELAAFEYQRGALRVLFVSPVAGVRDATWINDESFVTAFEDRGEKYSLRTVDTNGHNALDNIAPPNFQPRVAHSFKLGPHSALQFTSTSEVVLVETEKNGQIQIRSHSMHPGPLRGLKFESQARSRAGHETTPPLQLMSMLPVEVELIVLGYSDGHIRKSSFAEMVHNVPGKVVSDKPLDGGITGLYLVHNQRTKEPFIFGRADDGSMAIWELESLKLCAQRIIFTTPILTVLQFQDEYRGQNACALRGCVLCCSQDGMIAFIAVDGFQLIYVIPGFHAALSKVYLGGDNFLLMYSDGRVRLWDIKTREFWRSMAYDKARDLVLQAWSGRSLEAEDSLPGSVWSTRRGTQSLDSYVVKSLTQAPTLARTLNVSSDAKLISFPAVDRLRSVLSVFLTPGLNEEIDVMCKSTLHIPSSNVTSGFSNCVYSANQPQDMWCISADVSAIRALIIVANLRVYSLFEDILEVSQRVITFYATSLAQVVGPSYQPPSLAFLARCWFDCSNELRNASQILFEARISRLAAFEANTVVEDWQTYLPSLQHDVAQKSIRSALALFLCGYIATEKYFLFSASALMDISKSITLYLHDENSYYKVLAIDLFSRGFGIWQHYVDAKEMLRTIFTLGTSSHKERMSTHNIGPRARLAVLHIASGNTSLFMSTLALEIHSPCSVEQRKCVAQILVFLIRKIPLVLYPNLPRLMEAVVKSMDPNSIAIREAVLDTVTEIIGQTVKSFPTVDFHMNTQLLAVGTSEGAIVMYDLKTATRLYVLKNHKKCLAACSFSPDGRRLVTISLEEGIIIVWKVGSNFSSAFNPGTSHSGSELLKILPFDIGEDANMTIADTLDCLHIDWLADRIVRLNIHEHVLTFNM